MSSEESAQTSDASDAKQAGGLPGFRLAARDPLFAVVLVILAVAVGGALAVGKDWSGAVVSAVLLWGIVRLRQWALWATVVLGGLQVLYLLTVLPDVLRGSALVSLIPIPINVFALLVLLTRREHFLRGL